MCFGNSMTRADTHLYITYAPRSVAELNREIQREKSKVHQTFNTEAFQKTKITQLMMLWPCAAGCGNWLTKAWKLDLMENLARLTRFERATTAFGGQYSIQLSYRRVGGNYLNCDQMSFYIYWPP